MTLSACPLSQLTRQLKEKAARGRASSWEPPETPASARCGERLAAAAAEAPLHRHDPGIVFNTSASLPEAWATIAGAGALQQAREHPERVSPAASLPAG